jgi:hypothetical protein
MGGRSKSISPEKNDESPSSISSPDLSPYDFWFFGYAKGQLKDQLITDNSDLGDKLTAI